MINPDYLPWYFALPLFIVLCVIWRRQVIKERRQIKKEINHDHR